MNIISNKVWGFLGGTVGKESSCHCRRHKRRGFNPWVGNIPWNKKWQFPLVFLPGRFHGQRSLEGYSPRGHKESDTTEWLSTHKVNYRLNLTPILRLHVTKSVASSTWGQGGPKDFPQPSHLPPDRMCFTPTAPERNASHSRVSLLTAFPFTPQTTKQRSFLATRSHSSCHGCSMASSHLPVPEVRDRNVTRERSVEVNSLRYVLSLGFCL